MTNENPLAKTQIVVFANIRRNEYQEYVVRGYNIYGRMVAEYFTDDADDAKNTKQAILEGK